MRTPTRALVALVLLFGLQACSTTVIMGRHAVGAPVQEAMTRNSEDLPPAAPTQGSVHVTVADTHGGLNLRNGRDTGNNRYVLYDLPTAPEGASVEEMTAFYEAFFQRMNEEHNTQAVIQIVDFAPALAMALRFHLQRHFREVQVDVGHDGPGLIVPTGAHLRDDGVKRLELTLALGDARIEAQGRRSNRKHLAWMTPLALLTFPIGAAVVLWVGPRLARAAFARALGDAVDHAARQLAEHIAEQCRQAQRPSYCSSPARPESRAVAAR